VAPERAKELDSVELNLRRAAGRFSEVEKECFRLCDEIRALAPAAIEPAAKRVVEYWSTSGSPAPASIVADAVRETASLSTNQVQRAFLDLSSELAAALADAAQALQVHNPQIQDDLLRAVREMPLFELSWPDSIEQPWFGSLGRALSLGAARRILLTRLRSPLDAALTSYARVLEPWCRDTLKDLQRRFDAQADPYRVQFSRPRNVIPAPSA
jgi:hypothetical protein